MQASIGRNSVQRFAAGDNRPPLLCFSHLRWDFVFQRPQHLLIRAARTMRVLYWQEPIWTECAKPCIETHRPADGVLVVQPHLPYGCDAVPALRELLDALVRDEGVVDPVLWYYTPQALEFSGHLRARVTVYDCMDELSASPAPTLPCRRRSRT